MRASGSGSIEVGEVRVSLAESAVQDLEEARDWYAKQAAPEAARKLLAAVVDCLTQLQAFPESGRIVLEFDQPWLRELIRPPFRIVYRLDDERVRIVRVWRSERLLPGEGEDLDEFGREAARRGLAKSEWSEE